MHDKNIQRVPIYRTFAKQEIQTKIVFRKKQVYTPPPPLPPPQNLEFDLFCFAVNLKNMTIFVWFDSLHSSQRRLCQGGSSWVQPVLSRD